MNLEDLGFDPWFQKKQVDLEQADTYPARVTAVDRDRFLVRNEHGEVAAEITGKLRFNADSSMDMPAVGDWVLVQYYDDATLAIIHAVFPRKSFLRRKSAGKKIEHQLIAANIDTAFIVQSCDANFNVRRLERYLVMIRDGHIDPKILLSKTDLIDDSGLKQRISEIRIAGIECGIIGLSNADGSGVDEVRRLLVRGKTYSLLGSSGVGKTTLLNHLVGTDAFDTRRVREGDGKGRHTTTRRQLVLLDGGSMVIDTPGMRELASIGVENGIDESFADILELAKSCHFNDCTHTHEAGCAVLSAVESGELDDGRYGSYMKLAKESAHYEMSYVEKRKKDRELGRFYRSVLKHKKKQ